MADELRIMIAAGGTGGHVFPAIAIAEAIREQKPKARFLFVGTRDRMEWKAVPSAGFDIVPLWISGLHRRLTLKNLLLPLKLLVSLWQSRTYIRKFRPHAMISCGSFVAGPVGWMAARYQIPLFLQEQNSFPGITNRKLAGNAEYIFTAFKQADQWFPAEKTICAGNPVRKSLMAYARDPVSMEKARAHFNLNPDRPVLLVMGGSGGARSINEAIIANLASLHDNDQYQIIWQCGEHYMEEIKERLHQSRRSVEDYGHLRLYGFMNDITEAWAAADVIVSRAGAITCSELMATGKAGILVPSPWVAGDHQTRNAEALADQGAAVLLKDDELKERLSGTIRSLMDNPSRRKKIEETIAGLAKPDAADSIAKTILERIQEKNEGNSSPDTDKKKTKKSV